MNFPVKIVASTNFYLPETPGVWVEREANAFDGVVAVYNIPMEYGNTPRGVHLEIRYLPHCQEYHIDGCSEAPLSPTRGTQYNMIRRAKTWGEAVSYGQKYLEGAIQFVGKQLQEEENRMQLNLNILRKHTPR